MPLISLFAVGSLLVCQNTYKWNTPLSIKFDAYFAFVGTSCLFKSNQIVIDLDKRNEIILDHREWFLCWAKIISFLVLSFKSQNNTQLFPYVIPNLSFLVWLGSIEAAICWGLEVLYHIKWFPFIQCLCDSQKDCGYIWAKIPIAP